MVAAVMVVALVVTIVGHNIMFVCRSGLMVLVDGRFHIDRFRGGTNHRGDRKRLNRKAQCQQHDKKEFAPVGHGCEV